MAQGVWGEKDTQYFYQLTPELVLDAVEHALGMRSTGRSLQLNSMENRVFEIEMEEEVSGPKYKRYRIAKFYRPGRWTKEQIQEEHQFLLDLEREEIPVAAPLRLSHGETLMEVPGTGLFLVVFQKKPGRNPYELDQEQLSITGRLLGRLHNIGAVRKAEHRVSLTPETYGRQNLAELQRLNIIPPQFSATYADLVHRLCDLIDPLFARVPLQRIHGDCHRGNLLWGDEGPFWVDFDDCVNGPPVQDLWLLLPGRGEEAQEQLDIMLRAYESMREFDHGSLRLIEPLRALRYVHFSTWIAKRWQDPAFPRTFPQFGTEKYWQEQMYDLQEQIGLIQNIRL